MAKVKVAIISSRKYRLYDEDGYETERELVQNITDWEEIDSEDAQLIVRGLDKISKGNCKMVYEIIEHPVKKQKELIIKSLAEGRALIAKELKRQLAYENEQKKEKKEREQKKRDKDEKKRREEYERLKAEFGIGSAAVESKES